MKRTITIGSHDVEMVANAASPIFFKRAFKQDFHAVRQRLSSGDADDPETLAEITELFTKMGYIMAKQAEAENGIPDASEEDFVYWLMQFAPTDMDAANQDIVLLYHESEKGTAVPKQ